MATLTLVRDAAGELLLYGRDGEACPTHQREDLIGSLDGEICGCPYCVNLGSEWTVVDGAPSVEFADDDSWWDAREKVLSKSLRLPSLSVAEKREIRRALVSPDAPSAEIHVTAIRNGDVIAHETSSCDEAGCAAGADTPWLLVDPVEVEVSHVYEINERGQVTAELVD